MAGDSCGETTNHHFQQHAQGYMTIVPRSSLLDERLSSILLSKNSCLVLTVSRFIEHSQHILQVVDLILYRAGNAVTYRYMVSTTCAQ